MGRSFKVFCGGRGNPDGLVEGSGWLKSKNEVDNTPYRGIIIFNSL
jgi:hypothetical protein